MKKILVVDSEKAISDIIKFNLEKEGFEVFTAFDGQEALDLFAEHKPHLVLTELILPNMDGLEVCRQIRQTSDAFVIIVSSKDSEFDKVVGLEVGADDYVTKPFSNRELIARIKANLRRYSDKKSPNDERKEIFIDQLHINPFNYTVSKGEKQIELTKREFELIYYLAQRAGEVITREELLENVWAYDYFGDVRTVDVTIRRLREKVETHPSRPEYISTRRSVGYFMNAFHD